MYRGNFGSRFSNREDRNRLPGTSEFHENGITSRFSARDDDQCAQYGPAKILDRQGNGSFARNYELGQNSSFGTPLTNSSNSWGMDPQKRLFSSPMTPGSVQNPFSFGNTGSNSLTGGISGDQITGSPNFQFLVAPGQQSSIPNPFSASGMTSMQNFQLPATGSGYSGLSGNVQMANFQNSLKSTTGALNSGNATDSSNQMNNFRNTVKIPSYQQIVTPGVRLQTNPYEMSNQTSYASHQLHLAAPYSNSQL